MNTDAAPRRSPTPRPPFSESHDLRLVGDDEARTPFGMSEVADPVSFRTSAHAFATEPPCPSTPTVRIYPVDEYAD